ncbi:coiled-coil domain-containing protein 168 [Mirounga leonina]|uniref:coiled-coil domain-containing protein 168 n=1 Tax=Mirounga leonina TaxID=9715 RepID=UPI00156C39E2|nr:coiled-coil domain-containing protein 168 [Mirounga leonina]
MRWAYHLFVFWGIQNRRLQNETSIYLTYYIKMSKQFYFFKKAVQNRLEDNTFWTLWELVESWTQNDWMAIFFIIFLGIIVEIILIKICTSFTKKPALPEKGSSSAQEVRTNDNCPIPSSSEESYKRGWDFKGTVRREKEQGLSPETLQRGPKEEEEPSKETGKELSGSEEENQENYDGLEACQMEKSSCMQSVLSDNSFTYCILIFRVDDFSERTITSSLTSEENESDFEDRVSTADEVIWSSTSESKYQVSHFSESHMISSNGTSSSLSLFRSEVKEFSPSRGGYPENEHETVQFSSKKLFSIMKTNKNKNLVFSSDFNFSRSSRITTESEDLSVAPCPPAHLFLSRDQVRLLEENVRNQIALKSKTTLESKTTYLYSRLQESLIQNQHSVRMGISTQPQDSFPGQNAPQNQHFYEARYTSQAQQFVNNQESVNSQPDIMARYFALPQDLVRKPFSSSMQDSFQTQDMDRSQHLVNVSYSVETQDSVKGLESDKHFEQAQYSVWLKDSNKIKYLIRGQNAIFKNARFLVLMLSPNSFAEGVLQIKTVKPGGQKQIASSELSQYSVYGSGPLSPILKRQKNRRKKLPSKSKLSLKVPSQMSKKTPTLRVFQMTVCHTSKPSKFGYKYNAKKEELHQRCISEMALHLTYVSKLIPPYVKKYARKKLVKVMPGVTGCRHSLSPDAENVSYVGSIEKRGTSGSTKNKKQHGRENKGQITISPKIPPQLEQSFMINTFQLKSPCSSLIEMTWKNKVSLKDPITQAKEIGIAEFCAPNSKKTSDLHIPKQESPLKEALSEPWQKFVSSPEVESNRRLKTQEDLKSTENSHLPLSSGEKLPTSSPEMQKCFPDGNTQKQKDFLEIVLETSEVNLLISLGIKEHEGSEQLASVKTQDRTEDVIMKEKKPLLTLHVTECDNLSESEGLECNTRSNIKNMQGKRIFATFHNATNTTISEPPDREMHSGLKGKTDTSTTGVSHSVVKLEKLPDEKKTWDVKYIEKRCIFKKSQEHDRGEEEQTFQEAVPELTQDFSLSLQLKQKPKYVRFEIKQSSSGSRKTQSKEQEVQPQTLPTETILGTSPCPPMDPFQSRDRPTGRGAADPENPLPVLENPRVGEVLIETTECGVPFGGNPRKIPDDHITEEKADLQQVLPATALGSFIIYMLPLSHFKRQQIRKRLSGAKRVLSPKSIIMKVKKPINLLMPHIRRHGTASLRKRLRGNFKILIKEMLQDKIVADVLVNVTYPHMSILPRIRTHGRLNAENHGQTKLKQEKSEDEREEKYSDSINKGSDSGNTLEEVKLQDEVRGDKEARPEAVLHDSWNLQLDANPEKELKAEEDIPQPITSMETLTESIYSSIMDLFHVETMKKSLTTQADLKCTADSETPLPTSETPLPTSEKSLAGDPPNQTRESDVLDYGSDAREMGYFSAETSSAELPKDLPATFPETFNCHMPILTHSKMNKNKVRFSSTEGSVKPRSVHTKTMKPSVSQVFNSTGQRKKLDSKYKAKLEKINQANGLVYEFINTLYSPMQSFCHAQLKQGELGEVRPRYIDFFDKSRAFHDREEKVEDGEEVEQKTLLEAASQHTQYLWPDACQGKKIHLDEPDSALDCLTQELSVNEQDAQHQAWFVQTALQTGHQKGPREAEELKKTSETENDITAPMGPKIPSPKAQNSLPPPENSRVFIFNAYQKENCDLVKSDEELKQPRSINIQVQPRIHGTQAILGSASCPMVDQFQLGKLESYARFSPPKSGEARMDEIIFSTREYGVPSDANHQKEQAGGIEKKDTVTFDFCIPALSTFKRKKHLKKYSDTKTLVNLKCGILKAKKPSVSYILSIKGDASPNHRKELEYNSTTKLEKMDQGEKMAAKMYSFMSITPDINRYSNTEREKGMLGEKSLSSKQVKQALLPHQENITSDDTEENSLQDAEEKRSEQETLKVIPQHGQHFKFCSGQREELDLHQSENQGRGNILFVTEQGISQQMQRTDSMQGEKPKKSYQTQNGAICTASSKLPLLKSKKSLIGQVLMDTMKGGVLSVGSHMGELYSHDKEENAEFKKDLQATVLESSDLGKSPCDGEVWKANSADPQNRSSNTMKMNVQHEREEENIKKMLSESVPHYNQHFSFSAHHMKNFGSYQSESELSDLEVRSTWNLSCAAQKMRQEKCFRETILEPVSRHVMNLLQVETEKKSLHTQERIKCMGGLKTPFPKARKSETGSIQGGVLWGGNPRRKWDSYIFEKKAWNQNDLVRIVLKSSGFSSLDSCEPKSQSYTLEFVGKKSIINPKHVTLKAKKRSVSQLLNITGCITGSHRKMKGCKFQYKMKTRQWFEGVGEASLLAAEGTKIPPPKLVTDERSLDATARGTLYNRTLHRNLHGHITEEKAELWENSATTFLEPVDFFTPILSDSESQINTVRLLEEKITLNPRCLTLKEKEPAISQILKIRGRFTTKRRKKLGSNLKTKMQQMSQGKNGADTFPNTIYFTPDTYDIERQSRFKIGMDRVSRFSHVQPTQMQLPVEGLVISQPFNITGHAALSINEQQGKKIDRKREKTVLNVDLKFVYDSMPILSHLKMEPSPSTWDIYEESSGKRNALNKANASSAYAYIPMYPKIIKHKAKAKTAGVKNTMHIRQMKLKAKKPPVSQLFNTIGCGTRRNKKELRCDIKKQKEFQQDKTIVDLFLNTVCDSGSLSSQIKQFTEVEREKSRPRKPINVPPQLELEKSLNKRKMSSSESTDIKSAFSRNIKTLKQCIREQKEKRQIVLLDLLPQCRDQLVISQHVKKELDHVKMGVALKREVYSGLASQKREINYTRFDIPRIRTHTECEFLVAPRVKHKDADVVKHSVSIPWGRGVSKKTSISLNSKGQNIFLTELDASHQKTHKEQEFQKQGSMSLTIQGSFAYPIMEPPHLKNTGKVAEEDIYTNKRNISHLLRREDIKETNISQGSKGQKFLYTSLVGQQTMSAAQKGEVKPAGVPESIVDSVSHPDKEPLQVTQAVNTKKEDVSTSLSLRVNPGRKERSELTDIPLRLNGQKMTSEKLGVKQLHSSNQNKENILESISSCMLDQFYNEKLKKKVSAKGVSSKVLSSVVDKALNEADTPVDQPSLSLHNRRRKEHQKESTCKVLPKSVSHSLMDVLQIKLPCVKKTLKAPTYHTANTEGIRLLVEGKEEEHPECIHYISPKSASHSLRDVLQSKIPCEKKASEEVVSIVDYIPSTEKISSLVTGKESKVHTGKGQSGMKLTSLCTSLPSLSQTNVNSRIKVGQDKSGIPRSCLPPLKLQVSPNVRKTSFAESFNRGSLSNVRESKYLPQGKKEDGVYMKDIRGLKCVTFKGKKTPFEHTLHGKEPQWNNKEQEEMMQKDKSNLDIVQSKRHTSIPSSPHVEWDPGIKEVLMRGITGFCLPSLTLQELSDTMGICEEPADDILSSIKKAKYMPQKDGVEMALEEIRHPKRIALKVKRTPIAHELQLNIKEKEKKMQEDKDEPVGIQSKSCVSISFPPYSEVDTRIKGEEALLIKTRPSFLQTELQESSDRGKIAYKQSIHGDTSNSVKESNEHYIMQEEEEKVKMVKVILLRKKRSPILQEIQLDIKEQEEKTQKIKGEPNVLVTNTSTCIPAPSHLQLDTRIEKADYVTEVTRSSLPELSQQKSSDAVKKANKSTDGDITSDVQEAKEHTPQKEETNVEKSAKRDMMHPKDKDLKRKKALLQDIPLNLKEQVKEDPEGEEQGKVDRGGKGEQEVVLPTNWASESLTHHELNTRIGEEDRQEITGSAVSQLQLQKSSDAGKIVYTKSAGDDTSNDVRVVQEYEPQEGEDRRKIVNIKYIMYPKGTTSKAKVLPLPHVLCISGGCDAQIREVQTSIKEKLRYIQERSELGKVLTRPSLPQFKLNKNIEGKEEKQVSRPFLLPSWPRESSNAEKLTRTVLPLNDTSNDSKRTKYMTQREEDKANTFEKDIMQSMYIALRAKKSPLSLIVKTKKLQVNIKEQVKVGQEDNKETVVLLRKIHPFLISSTHLKWNTIKDEEGEPGIIINDAPHLELQESLPSGQLASTDSPDSHVKKGDPRPRQAERNGVQTGAMNGSAQPQGTDFKAKTSPPSHTFSVTEHGALNQRKEPQWHMKEKVEQEQQRTGDPDVALTKTSPSTPSPSYHRLGTRTKVDKDLLAVTGFSPSQLLGSKSSGAGKIRYADSSESIRSCNVIIKAYQSMPYTEVKDRVKIKGGKDRRFPQIITSTAETSPLRHLPSRKRLPLNIKEQGKEVPEGESEPEMVLKETYAALPSPSYLKWDTRMNEKEDTLRITQSYFPPPKIQDPSSSGKKPYTKSFDGCVLREKDRLKTDLENKMVPIPMALKAKELPLSRILDTKKLQWKIKEQERKVQKDENDLATHLENICTSLLTLPYLKFGSREGEGYMIRITELPLLHLQSKESPGAVKTTYAETTDGELSNDVKKLKEHTLLKEVRDREKKVDMNSMVDPNDRYLKAKKSPNLLRYNLSALWWKTKKQEGTAQEGQREPGGAVLTKTCTCRSPLLHFNTNTRVEEKRIPILTRSSFPTVNSQESSDSEDMECIEPITSDILISPQKGKYHMPQNKEKDGVEIVNLMFPKHQEKKMQESEDEPSVVVANSSSPLPSLPHLQLDKETQVGDEMLGPARSVVQRESNAGEVVHTEAIHGDVMKDSQNKKQLVPQEEEQYRKKTIDMRNMTHTTDTSLKSRKSPPLLMLHRTELHLNIGGQEQKKDECPGKPPGTVLRKIYVSKPPAEITLDKGIQVDEERLRIKRLSLIPQMLSAVSDIKMRADTGEICDIRERKQHMSQKEKKHEVKTVDMRIRMHHKEARISSISHIFNTKEFVLNIKELKENVYKGKDELPVVLTRTFLSVPSAPSLYLDSGSKVDKDVPGLTGSSPPQQNLQESSDTQKTAIREVVAGDGEIVKKAGHSVHQEKAVQQWTSNFMISVQRRNEPPRVKSEGDLSQLVLNSQHENIYLTGFGTISGKRLEYFFTGQEVQPEKYKTETFTTFLSYPTMEPTKIGNLKKQTEIMDNLNHKISPKVLVTPPRKISKEIYITFDAPVSAKGFSVSEQDAHQQKTLSKASPGSADSYKFDKPAKDVHNNDKVSKMLSPKVLAPQTEGSLEKMNIAESDTSPIIEEQEIVVKKQVVLQSESGHKTWLDSSFSLKFPLQNGRQKTPLETDVHKQTIVYPRIQILPGIHMDITVFDTIGGKKEQGLPVPQQEEYILESLQKSLSSHWTFPLQSGDLEGKNKMDTSTTINLEQKTLEMEEGELKIDTNIAIRLAADKTEMHKHTMVNLEENKKRDTSNTVNLNIPSLKAQIPQINTQLITHRANSCPIKQKHKKELEVSGAKQNIQPQKLFQKHVLDSFYAYIPLSLKFKGWKGRLTVADLKRELSPKYLTMKIPNHPVSQILNNMGHGTPSNRKKLEYDLKRPKRTVLRSEGASGIFVRSLSISTVSSSQIEEIVDSETNRGREKILCPSAFQQKSPHTQGNSLSTVKDGDQNFTDTAPQDSQPSVVEEQQMQKLPSVKSEANLGSETKEKNLIPQTKEERVVPGHDSSRIIKESDLRMTEEEGKAPKPLLTPAEGPLMSDEPKDDVEAPMESTLSMSISPPGLEEPQHGTQLFNTMECISPPRWGDQSEPIQATTAQNVQHQKPFPGTGPIPSQVKSNEIKVVAGSTGTESLLPLFEAIKNIFESQIKNMIYDNICEDILKKGKAPKPDDWKLPPRAGSPDTTCTTVPPAVQPKPILERFTPKENNKLTNHFESKAFEIKLNLIPEMAKQSFQKFNFYLNQSFSEDNSWRLYPRHKKMCFLSLKGIDTVELHLKQKCAQDSPPVSCMKTLIVRVSRDSEEITTKLRRISKLESGVSSVTSAKQMPWPHILQNYSVEEKDKLLIHFSMKTLEIHMKAFPRIVRESYAMGSPQNIRKPLSKCIHSGFKVPRRKNRILLLFEEKSLHQIDLDLQYKYLHFLLGLPVGSVFPKPTALPKHILKLNTVAICENIGNRGESGGDLCTDMELLEQHISFKNQSPRENSSLRRFREPTLVCASDPNQQGPVQKDTTALSELKSHTPLEKDQQCHVWCQETDKCKSFDSKTQESTPSLVDSHSTQISEDFTEGQTNVESSANVEECSAPEAHESEECMFLEANPFLSQESQNILFELQEGIPLENLYKMKKSKTTLKPLCREDSGSQHIRGCRKHSSIVTPSYESHKSRKYRSSSKMPSPDWSRHGSLNAGEVLSRSSSIPFSEEKSSWTARCRTNHSLAPLTESNIKLHLAKGQGKPHRHLESKEGKKAKSDLFRKNNIHWDCDYSYTWTKEKCTRKKKVRNCESERSNYFSSKPKLPSKLHQEDINFHSERKQNQPFFYACIPADSLEIMPQTIRWTIPPRTLRKTNFRVPLVAKISSSFNIWTSSKKFLESLLESFSPVHPNRY